MKVDLDREDMMEAISEGVRRGIMSIVHSGTDMPCADFLLAVERGVSNAMSSLGEAAPKAPIGTPIAASGLNKRVCNGLLDDGFKTMEEVRSALEGHYGRARLLRIPNFGRKSLNDVLEYLGMTRY